MKRYNPLDFRSYKEEYNPYGFDNIYPKFLKRSTPITRFKEFLSKIISFIINK